MFKVGDKIIYNSLPGIIVEDMSRNPNDNLPYGIMLGINDISEYDEDDDFDDECFHWVCEFDIEPQKEIDKQIEFYAKYI